MCQYVSDRMSEYMSDQLSEYIEYMSKYTSWNVMVGITRSKVIAMAGLAFTIAEPYIGESRIVSMIKSCCVHNGVRTWCDFSGPLVGGVPCGEGTESKVGGTVYGASGFGVFGCFKLWFLARAWTWAEVMGSCHSCSGAKWWPSGENDGVEKQAQQFG